MPTLDKIPKDAIQLFANNLDDYMQTMKNWQNWGWLLASDYDAGLYSAIALKDSRVLILFFKDSYVEPQKTPEDIEAEQNEQDAIDQLNGIKTESEGPAGLEGPPADPDATV